MSLSSLYDARPTGFFGNRVARLAPATSGSVHAIGWSFTTSGAGSTPGLSSTSLRTQMRRTQFASSIATTVGLRTSAPVCWRGTDGLGGFRLSVRFCIEGPSGRRAFIGVAATSTPVTDFSDPSSVANVFGIGSDLNDTTWSIIHGDGTTTTKTAISGATINSDVLELTIYCAPSASAMGVQVVNLTTGTTLLRNAEYTTTLPDAATLLYFHAHIRTIIFHAIEIAGATLELPDGARYVEAVVGRNGVYSPRDFGARGDAVTDDLPAFKAALDAMGTAATLYDREGTLDLGDGAYYLSDNLAINRAVLIKGAGTSGRRSDQGPARLIFPEYKGIRIYKLENDPTNVGDATNVAIEDVQIETLADPASHAVWEANHAYALGAKVLPAAPRTERPGSSLEYYYEVVKAGTSALDPPDGAGEPDWTETQHVCPPFAVWQQSTNYMPPTVIRSSVRWDVLFVCVDGGQSGAGAEPGDFATAVSGEEIPEGGGGPTWLALGSAPYLIADNGTLASPGGGVIWACRVAAGIYAQGRFSLRRVTVVSALNAAVHVQGGAQPIPPAFLQPGNANGFSIYGLDALDCGGGIVTRDHDVNAGVVVAARIRPIPNDDRTFGIADKGQGGNRFVACEISGCAGRVLDQRSDTSVGGWFGCTATSDCGASKLDTTQGYGLFGVSLPSGFETLTTSSILGALGRDDWREVWSLQAATSAKLYADPYLMSFEATTDAGFHALTYDTAGLGLGGWWSVIYSSGFAALAWSGTNAAEGGGHAWAYQGLLVGDTRSILTTGDADPSGGAATWRQGDIVINTAAASGQPSYWQCVTSGTPGTWLPGPALP